MDTNLVVSNQEVGIRIYPEETIEMASLAAKALKRVISLKTKPVILNGEQYLEFEDLQLVGQFYGYTVKTGEAMPVEVDGVKGAKARADLIDFKTGMYLGGAEAYCMRDEEHWNTRPKYEWQGEGNNRKRIKVGDEVVPWFQLASMAQTRAGAKAFRNRLAWVVVLAGYGATPAEEITEGTVSEATKERRTVDKSEHYCQEHGVNFFKKGRMKRYAHPIGGTDKWCNEEAEKPDKRGEFEKEGTDILEEAMGKPKKAQEKPPDSAGQTTQTTQPPDEKSKAETPEGGEVAPFIDLDWFAESLKTLQGKKLSAWSDKNLLAYMKTSYGVEAATPLEAAKLLDRGKAIHLVKKIQETLEMM